MRPHLGVAPTLDKKRRKPMSDKNTNTRTNYIMSLAVRAHFAKLFCKSNDPDGTPLCDLYLLQADSRVLTAWGKPPFVPSHSWRLEDQHTPFIAAAYHPSAHRFDVISFVIKEVISATEIEISLYDIFTLGANGFGYMVESEGTPFDLIMDFETNYYGGDYPALMLHAEDYDQPVERIMDWAWAMIGSVATEQPPKSLAS